MNCDFYIPDGFDGSTVFSLLPVINVYKVAACRHPQTIPFPDSPEGPGVFCCPKILLRDDAVDIQGKVWHWHVWHEHTKSSSTHSDSDACMPTWLPGGICWEEACISWSYPLNQFSQPVDFAKKKSHGMPIESMYSPENPWHTIVSKTQWPCILSTYPMAPNFHAIVGHGVICRKTFVELSHFGLTLGFWLWNWEHV